MRLLSAACVLLLAAVALAPVASAEVAAGSICDSIIDNPPQACYMAEDIAVAALGYVLCYYTTAPSQWVANCV